MRRQISKFARATFTIAAVLLFIGGCRHADVNRELVEREMRLQEDELYRLHDEVASREKLLETARRENATLKRELEQARGGAPPPANTTPAMPPAPTGDPPSGRAPPPDSGVPPFEVMPPKIEVPGRSNGQPPAGAATGRSSWSASRGVRRASFETPVEESSDQSHQRAGVPAGDRIAKIVLNRELTGGYNADRRPGDEGVTVAIEPRSKDDRVVARPGDISVVAIDPARTGEASRIARWDFTSDQIRRHLQTSPQGIQLELPWPKRPPEHERLVLFTRYTSSDGERHEASQSIVVDLAHDRQPDAPHPINHENASAPFESQTR